MEETEFEKNCFEIITLITQELEKRNFNTSESLAFFEMLSIAIDIAIINFKKKYDL